MRQIEIDGDISIAADEPDEKYGGASHVYELKWVAKPREGIDPTPFEVTSILMFQRGPLKEVGRNGVSDEALLAILIDRLEKFQAGAFACEENTYVLYALENARSWQQKRTAARLARGVEGTNVK
jgi:hypothetical protein